MQSHWHNTRQRPATPVEAGNIRQKPAGRLIEWERPASSARLTPMLHASQIIRQYDEATLDWHQGHFSPDTSSNLAEFEPLLLAHHRANYDLWHEEDKAREPGCSDARIASIKRAIDVLNQTRTDLVEALDGMLLAAAGPQNPDSPLHSESPGLILDRLSILALKLYHTAEESRRTSASEAHRQRNVSRLALLQEQRGDLAACLDALWTEALAGRRRFKLYRHLKMYNDPELNPAVYSHKPEAPAGRPG